jgi:ribosomal protein S18 acetylase RimI-like enzyme
VLATSYALPVTEGAITIRPAEPADYVGVGELTASAYLADGFVSPDSFYLDELRDAERRAKEAELLVAVNGQRLIGTVTFCVAGTPYAEISQPGEAEFRALAVDPAGRGRGIGSALVDACVKRAVELGCSRIVLSTQTKMTTAHRIYERAGFVRMQERDWSPVPGVDLIAFSLDLP